jgi:hypothetical protein
MSPPPYFHAGKHLVPIRIPTPYLDPQSCQYQIINWEHDSDQLQSEVYTVKKHGSATNWVEEQNALESFAQKNYVDKYQSN